MFGHELVHVVCKGFWLERIHGLTINVQWQSCIRNTRHGQCRMFSKELNWLTHVLGSRGAVETDDIDAHAFEDGERGVDVGAEQHATRRVERDLSLNRQVDIRFAESLMNARDGGFDFENVLRGFDEKKIDAALNETDGLFTESIDEFIIFDVREFGIVGGRKFARWSDRASHEAGLTCLLGIFIGKSACELRRCDVDLDDAVLQVVFCHRETVRAEGVRLQHIHADFKERAMDFFHGFRI